jgi:tyrosyl-tRNA synthetase
MSIFSKENAYNMLYTRNFIKQCTDEQAVRDKLSGDPVTCYAGFDPTADSLHAGHLVPVMALGLMMLNGHRPIALIGGGTGMIGDPSGKSEMRQMLSESEIDSNVRALSGQLGSIFNNIAQIAGDIYKKDFSADSVIMENNKDWIRELNYVDFLRNVGVHFSVNRMLSFEMYKMRMEKGLSFIEFNYQLFQSYDFLELNKRFNCALQIGGDDQWGNIVAGIDLVRRVNKCEVFGMTFPLITTSSGGKMGKTEKGAVWLSADKLSAYDYFQYFVNVDDPDVVRFLKLYTLLPVDEIEKVSDLVGRELNQAKEILAYEAVSVVHGRKEALKALETAASAFGEKNISLDILPSSPIKRNVKGNASIPGTRVETGLIEQGLLLVDAMIIAGLAASKGEARRLIKGGGVYLADIRVGDTNAVITMESVKNNRVEIRVGKKKHHCLELV